MIDKKIGFIGAGNMASAMIGGLSSVGVGGGNLFIFDPNQENCKKLVNTYNVAACNSNVELVKQCDVILLAVKPQAMQSVLTPLSAILNEHKPLLISIAAGISCDHIETWLMGEFAIVRVMPNTPALVNAGASGLFANERVSNEQKVLSFELLSAIGSAIWVENEEDINAVTALSGSGPAYFMLFIQSLIESGVKAGLKHDAATQLALETCRGTAKLIQQSDVAITQLIQNVTSPNGTTEAALNSFADNQFSVIVEKAFTAALNRSVQLGEEMN